jgi:hypothetical protein
MAKTKIKKVGISMLTQGSEWQVSSAIPVYGWESSVYKVNGQQVQRQNPAKVQLRTIPVGARIKVTNKPGYVYNLKCKLVAVQVIGEIENDLFIPFDDLDGCLAPNASNGRFYIYCRQRQQYYEGMEYQYIDSNNWRSGGQYVQLWINSPLPSKGFLSVSQARQFALVHTGEAARNPTNSNILGNRQGAPDQELVGDIVIVRTHLLNGDILDEHPLTV